MSVDCNVLLPGCSKSAASTTRNSVGAAKKVLRDWSSTPFKFKLGNSIACTELLKVCAWFGSSSIYAAVAAIHHPFKLACMSKVNGNGNTKPIASLIIDLDRRVLHLHLHPSLSHIAFQYDDELRSTISIQSYWRRRAEI